MEGQQYFQTQPPTRNESIIVTNSSQLICQARAGSVPRKDLLIRNMADDPTKIITINFGANPAENNKGIVLKQFESCTDSTDAGHECWQGDITAICAVASATADISIFER